MQRVGIALLCLLTVSPVRAAAAPDWVQSGGSSSRYSAGTHLVGFATTGEPNSLEQAKAQAAADLAKRIVVRVEQEVSDVSIEKNGVQSYAAAAVTRATTDVRLSGLTYETFVADGKTYALAILNKQGAAQAWRGERDESLARAKSCLERGVAQRKAGDEQGLRTLLGCRPALDQALAAQAMIGAIGLGRDADTAAQHAIAETSDAVDARVREVLGGTASTLASAVDRLATQLALQGVGGKARVTIAPLTYGATPFSSVLGRRAAEDVETSLASRGQGTISGDVVVTGTYFDVANEVAFRLVARDAKTGRAVAGAEARLLTSSLPPELPLKPQNFGEALKTARLLGEGEEVSAGLRVDVWTNKGNRNLVFAGGDEVKLYLRVNRPAWVRLVYLLASGAKVLLTQGYYIDEGKVNLAVEYPDSFVVSPPFGVEQIFATAFTEKPEPLPTEKRLVDGEEYDVVASLDTMVKHRGLKKKKQAAQTDDDAVALTTMPR